MAAHAADVTMVHFDTSGTVHAPSDAGSTQPGFTVWPAQSPSANQFNLDNGGTEYFLSSNAADEATHPVSGTGGAQCEPARRLDPHQHVIPERRLAEPQSHEQGPRRGAVRRPAEAAAARSGTPPGADVPQGHCINDTTTPTIAGVGCWRLVFSAEPAHDEVISRPDSNDTRMQQVTFANGRLWGALDTALDPDGGPQRAGIAWYIVNPASNKVTLQGYLGATGYDFTYPAIGVTSSGRGVMAFTATGDATDPSSGFAPIDAVGGVNSWNVVTGGAGAAVDDGFTSYKSQVGNPPRTRWGDYSAAAVDGNSIWIASEYIAHACDYTTWGGTFFGATSGDDKLGTCAVSPGAAGPRTALGNWSTRISKLTP